jgi:hypothetical protein
MEEDRIILEVEVGKRSTLQVVSLGHGAAQDVATLGPVSLDGVIDTIKDLAGSIDPTSTPSHLRGLPWSSASRWR